MSLYRHDLGLPSPQEVFARAVRSNVDGFHYGGPRLNSAAIYQVLLVPTFRSRVRLHAFFNDLQTWLRPLPFGGGAFFDLRWVPV